jgi:hypothetical protein
LRYDPDKAPDPDDWLLADEQERLSAVEQFHRRRRVRLPNATAHAIFHCIVENQLAMHDPILVERTLARLMTEGLSRHDAVHAIANVVATDMSEMLRDRKTFSEPDYIRKLGALTAERWLKQ